MKSNENGSLLSTLLKNSLAKYSANAFSSFRDFNTGHIVMWNYAQLDTQVAHVQKLLARHANPGERVVLLFKNRGLAYASMLACLYSYVVFIPLNPKLPAARLRQIIGDAGATKIFTDDFLLPQAQELQRSIPQLSIISVDNSAAILSGTASPEDIATAAIHPDAEMPAYILFTSGSTGNPKGIINSRGNLYYFLTDKARLFSIHSSDRFTQGYDLGFDVAIGEIFFCVIHGASLYPYETNEIPLLHKYFERVQPTIWNSTASTINFFKNNNLLKPGSALSFRASFFCGERLNHATAEYWKSICPNTDIHNMYGPTETTIYMTHFHWQPSRESFKYGVPLGQAFAHSQVQLVDENFALCVANQTGEIVVSGPQVALGYLNDQEKTEKSFRPMPWDLEPSRIWYCTGDLAAYNGKGQLEFIRRRDLQVKLNGYRIELTEIECTIREAMPAVDVVVFLDGDTSTGNAALVSVLDTNLSPDKVNILQETLRAKLPSYSVPSRMYFLKDWPLTVNGKTDRRHIEKNLSSLKLESLL